MRMGVFRPMSIRSFDQRGVEAANEGVEAFDFPEAFQVADGAVEDDAVAGLGEDRVAEVVADEGSVSDFAEGIGDVDVAFLQRVDGPGVHGADAACFVSALSDTHRQIRAGGHVVGGDGAADDGDVVVDHLPAPFELVLVAVRLQDLPGFLHRDVGKAVAFPFGGEEEELFAGDGLGAGGGRDIEGGDECEDQ
jgi:hypothetical protein